MLSAGIGEISPRSSFHEAQDPRENPRPKFPIGTLPPERRKRIIREEAEQEFGEGEWLDKYPRQLVAYEYLCHVAEAREWIQLCIGDSLPETGECFYQSLRNGVYLARLALFFAPHVRQKIFDLAQQEELKYKHIDNINLFFNACRSLRLPSLFLFTTPDLYDMKNIVRVIYCIHAIAYLLYVKGLAPRMPHLFGRVDFSKEVLDCAEEFLKNHEGALPSFRNIKTAMQSDLTEEEKRRAEFIRSHEEDVKHLQAMVRGHLARQKFYSMPEAACLRNECRSRLASHALDSLKGMSNVKLDALRRYLIFMIDCIEDVHGEQLLQELKERIIMRIRRNTELEKTVNALDIKIGLLVRNRITLEDAVEQTQSLFDLFFRPGKKLNPQAFIREDADSMPLNALLVESRRKLEAYEHLFYLLQTEPRYLAALFFQLSASELPNFIENAVLALFSYAQNSREEYMLLKLFRCSIEQEMDKLDRVDDLLTGNPVLFKLIVHYVRRANEREYLLHLIGPLVEHIIKQSDEHLPLDIDLDPISVYHKMIRDEETQTGRKSSLPYEVTFEEALVNEHVRTIIHKNTQKLVRLCDFFLARLEQSADKLPYGIRFVASEIKSRLLTTFPDTSREKLLKIVGNLIYYRYINPAIVAPDVYDVINAPLTPLQRKNLGEVAKILQWSASSKLQDLFVDTTLPDHGLLKSFIQEAQGRLFDFFENAMNVEDLETHFHVFQYNDMAETQQPIVFISPNEVFATHSILLAHLQSIAPDDQDPLRKILFELGSVPPQSPDQDGMITLTLSPKFDPKEMAVSAPQMDHLYVDTKIFLLPVIFNCEGDDLHEVLHFPVDDQAERQFAVFCESKRRTLAGLYRSLEVLPSWISMKLNELKSICLHNLQLLEEQGRIKSSDHYQSLLKSIATDLLQAYSRRHLREAEMDQLWITWEKLGKKTAYLNGQVEEYNAYIRNCIERQAARKQRRVKSISRLSGIFMTAPEPNVQDTSEISRTTDTRQDTLVPRYGKKKFTAAKLLKKGVIIALEDVPKEQYGLITFTFSSDEIGIYDVSAKFMGFGIDDAHMEIRFDDLLQKQYENVHVLSLFDGAVKVNVHLLIYLLNNTFNMARN
jgi:Ras GTPase-activating-like protein IQGAP2/3